ncbi:hypothetical protein IP78_11310 [Brevundimonas sp. AAP58]|uniref:hypothetical protein n=1 Tax=Brevundimonas sp. AAP58 TaxID=1523422 RepID=UPI0006B9A26B|nr:hypothetical protein [Brevundimonas sp. AAP58]KPF78378.1 hypothetical protein IP78_11310 [Brevundimonas sp. AAP58]
MSSIVRPTPAQNTRRLIVLASVGFAVIAGQLQQFAGIGQTPAEFSADSDATLRVVGWAFAIWGPIYLGLIAYAVRQVLPQTGESDMIRWFGWPSVLAFLGIGWWILAAAWDAEIATIVLIFGSLSVLVIPLLTHARAIRDLPRWDRDRWLVAWPLGALAGWLTIASPVNLLTVATGNGDLPPSLAPTAWALLAVTGVAVFALFVTWRTRLLAYPFPIAWGLLGVFVAEQDKGNVALAFGALAASLIVLGGALVLCFRLRPETPPRVDPGQPPANPDLP